MRAAPVLIVVLIATTVLVGCSASSNGDPDAAVSAIVTPDTATASAAAPEVTPEGNIVNRFALEDGDCFNDYTLAPTEGSDEARDITTVVDCRRPHNGEVYRSAVHPGDASATFPGNTEMERWGTEACYGSFEDFVGRQYELSQLGIGVIRPTEETWSDPVGLHREVLCFVRAPDGAQLSGSMASSGI